MKVGKNGFQPEVTIFTIEPGETTELKLTLKLFSSPLQSAIEEVGASWIKNLGLPRPKSEAKTESNP